MVSTVDLIEARRRQLQQEIRDLDTAAHPLREQQRREETIAAMRRERHGVEVDLAGVLHKPDHWRQTVDDAESRNGWAPGMSSDELAETMRARLADIDAEIARLSEEG